MAKPAESEGQGPAEHKSGRTAIQYGWPWIAKRTASVVELGADWAIDAFTDKEPLAAGEVEREEFERVAVLYGEEKLGKVEAPIWIVLLLALAFLVASKYVGAPRKPAKIPAPVVPPKLTSVPASPVPVAAMPPIAVPDAAPEPATAPALAIVPPPEQPTTTGDAGNADAAPLGF